MTLRKLVVKGQGPENQTTFYVEARRDKVWITSYDCPFACEGILEPAQADKLVELINEATNDARRHKNNPAP